MSMVCAMPGARVLNGRGCTAYHHPAVLNENYDFVVERLAGCLAKIKYQLKIVLRSPVAIVVVPAMPRAKLLNCRGVFFTNTPLSRWCGRVFLRCCERTRMWMPRALLHARLPPAIILRRGRSVRRWRGGLNALSPAPPWRAMRHASPHRRRRRFHLIVCMYLLYMQRFF